MKPVHVYRDRDDAGRILAAHLTERCGRIADAVVLALPRGGAVVAAPVAAALHAPLELLLVLKIPIPDHPQLAMGAIAEGCFQVLDESAINDFQISPFLLETVANREVAELQRREERYRENHPPISVEGKTAVIVDDGIGSGFTMRAAIAAVRERGPKEIVVAAPVGSTEACRQIESELDRLVCPLQTDPFGALGSWYLDFGSVTDEEICAILAAGSTRDYAGMPPGLLAR